MARERIKWKDSKGNPLPIVKEVARLRNLGMYIREIARELDLTHDQVREALRRFMIKYPWDHKREIHMDLKKLPPVEKLLEFTMLGQEIVRDFDPRQYEVFPKYDTDKWIGVIFQGDWHFDHYKTDLPSLVKDLEIIGQEPEVFYIFNGDAGDWSDIRFKDMSMPSSIIPIQLRYEVAWHLIQKIPNLLAVVAGCHDDWLKNRGFFDIIRHLQKKYNELGHKTYYLGYGGAIEFTVGKQVYRMGIYHKFGYESIHNDFHPCMKYLKMKDNTADIVAIAHRHDKVGITYQYYQHIPRIFIRSGSHQYITDYAWKEGFAGAINRAPMVLLNGTEKRMKACVNFREGIQELRRLNKEKE